MGKKTDWREDENIEQKPNYYVGIVAAGGDKQMMCC